MDLLKQPADRILENWQKLAKGKRSLTNIAPLAVSLCLVERGREIFTFFILYKFPLPGENICMNSSLCVETLVKILLVDPLFSVGPFLSKDGRCFLLSLVCHLSEKGER